MNEELTKKWNEEKDYALRLFNSLSLEGLDKLPSQYSDEAFKALGRYWLGKLQRDWLPEMAERAFTAERSRLREEITKLEKKNSLEMCTCKSKATGWCYSAECEGRMNDYNQALSDILSLLQP